MKQILQSLKTGETQLADVPAPLAGSGSLLIRTSRTLVSTGTERMLVEFGKGGWLSKARQQPDKVRMVLDKARTDGILPTIEAVRSKLDRPLALGYCNVGRVLEAGLGTAPFESGQRVVSNSPHAEIVSAPKNLCARVPDEVSDDEAAFAVVGAIALQGIRLARPTLGECVVVTGLGLIGLLAVQLLRAQGCRVLGLDFDPAKLALAETFGAETVLLGRDADAVAAAHAFSRGRGVDAVIITASTASDEPVSQAANMCRKRGRIVLVGVTGLNLSRDDFYEKELTFQVSCSYGPGRYDPNYEERGEDYPVGFVRWTEQRNFEAVLDMMASGRIDVKPLISHRFSLPEAESVYDLIASDQPSLGILIDYPEEPTADQSPARTIQLAGRPATRGAVGLGFIGAGNYAASTLISVFAGCDVRLESIASAKGVSAVHNGRKFGFRKTTTDLDEMLADPSIDAVVIATRHDSHADLVGRALAAKKHVFVEKPLALSHEELDRIDAARNEAMESGFRPVVTVGFNRRYAPHAQQIKSMLKDVHQPKAMIMTANVGAIPPDHWVQDPELGGGRIVGEGCHFVDLLRFLADAPISEAHAGFARTAQRDTASIQLQFADGSIGAVHYFANGSKAFPKERLEVFADGKVLRLDNYRRLQRFGWLRRSKGRSMRQDKGQAGLAAAFVSAVRGRGPEPIPFDQLMEVGRVMIDLAKGP